METIESTVETLHIYFIYSHPRVACSDGIICYCLYLANNATVKNDRQDLFLKFFSFTFWFSSKYCSNVCNLYAFDYTKGKIVDAIH